MIGRCEEFDRRLEGAPGDVDVQTRWRRHLAGCTSCREQEAADALLREALPESPPELDAGFDARLRERLEGRLAESHPGGLRPAALWTLGAYGTAALAASLLVLVRLPWQSLAASPRLGIVLGALALLSPLVLLDRVGVVRPPG